MYLITSIMLFIGCQEVIHKQGQPERKNLENAISNNHCENTLEWLKENAATINPDSFPNLHQLSIMQDSIYQKIDKFHFDCLFGRDNISVTNFTLRSNAEQGKILNYPIHYIPYSKLCDVYLDSEQNPKAFTFFSVDGIGHTWLYYVSLNTENGQVRGIAEIAYTWGDMGFVWNEKSVWIDQNTVQKNIKEMSFDSTVRQASVKIEIEEEGEIIFSEPQITLNLSPEEIGLIHEQKSKEFWGNKE